MKNYFLFWNKKNSQQNRYFTPPTRHAMNWILPQRLAIGRFPKAYAQPVLVRAGIQTIITFCAEHEGILSPEISQTFQCFRFPLPDSHYMRPLRVEQLAQAVELLRRSLNNNRRVYVHCLAGVERSPSVCIAYLCRYQHLEVAEALHWVKRAHASTCPTTAQIQVIQEFAQMFTQPSTPSSVPAEEP